MKNQVKINELHSCLWCSQTFFKQYKGGSVQKFCNRQCKQQYEKSLRLWTLHQLKKENISVKDLQHLLFLEDTKVKGGL